MTEIRSSDYISPFLQLAELHSFLLTPFLSAHVFQEVGWRHFPAVLPATHQFPSRASGECCGLQHWGESGELCALQAWAPTLVTSCMFVALPPTISHAGITLKFTFIVIARTVPDWMSHMQCNDAIPWYNVWTVKCPTIIILLQI